MKDMVEFLILIGKSLALAVKRLLYKHVSQCFSNNVAI